VDGLGKRPEQQRPSLGLSCVHPRRRFSDSPGLRTEQAAPSPQLRGCHLFAPTGAQPGDERLRSLELSAYVGTTGRGFLLDNHYILGIEVLENESRSFQLFVLVPWTQPFSVCLRCLSGASCVGIPWEAAVLGFILNAEGGLNKVPPPHESRIGPEERAHE